MPQYSVRHGSSGFIAGDFDEFAACTARLMDAPELLSGTRTAACEHAMETSWDRIFEGRYEAQVRGL
jgi:hypothetical protein